MTSALRRMMRHVVFSIREYGVSFKDRNNIETWKNDRSPWIRTTIGAKYFTHPYDEKLRPGSNSPERIIFTSLRSLGLNDP